MDLCTGSIFYTTLATLSGRLSPLLMLRHWAVTFLGNLSGVLFVSMLITGCKWTNYVDTGTLKLILHEDGGTFDHDPFRKSAISFAVKKQVEPPWHQIFIRGIGANWLGTKENCPCLDIVDGMLTERYSVSGLLHVGHGQRFRIQSDGGLVAQFRFRFPGIRSRRGKY
jgi:Formate/nitrite transporter